MNFLPFCFGADKERALLSCDSIMDCKVAAFRVKTGCVYYNYLNSEVQNVELKD